MSKKRDPLALVRKELCDAWEKWPDRTNPKHWTTMNMLNFYSALRRDYPDIAERLPPETGDEIWQRVKYLLLDHEAIMGRG